MNDVYYEAMKKLDDEHGSNIKEHIGRHSKEFGVRSSQISALIAMLVDIGVINENNIKKK